MSAWAKYAVEPEQEIEEVQEEVNPFQKTFSESVEKVEKREPIDWSQYQEKEDEGYLGAGGRLLARVGARTAETLGGLPKDIYNLVEYLNSLMPEPPKFLQREPSFAAKWAKKGFEALPSSQEIKNINSYLSSGYTDPQSAIEKFGDDVFELTAMLAAGDKNPLKFKSLLKNIGKSTLAKGAAKGTEKLGGGPKTQAAAEIGTLILTGLIAQKTADRFVSDKYKAAKEAIPEGTMVETDPLMRNLNKVKDKLSKGLPKVNITKSEVLNTINELETKIKGGAAPFDEIIEAYHDINKRMLSKQVLGELTKNERRQLKFRYNMAKNALSKFIDEKGKTIPGFLDEWRGANEAFGAIAQSKRISNFFLREKDKIPEYLLFGTAIKLFTGELALAAKTVGVGASTAGGVKTYELMNRILKSPTLRKHYQDVLKNASKENLPGVINSLKLLDKGLEKKD